ncbi:MAG: SDR family oxidoreductase [Hyphomicrobiaceae bacterium]
MRLQNKVAIVTGAASGFGKGIVELYAKEGAKVCVSDINGQGAREVANAIGERAIHVAVDVANPDDVQSMIGETVEAFGGVDIMVNNAGYTHKNQPMLDVSEAEFDRIFDVNVKAIFLAAKAVVPELEKRGGGSIITTASTAGVRPRPGLVWYNSSKGAAITMSKAMAIELAPKKIRVNAINPVAGDTPMLAQFMGEDTPEIREKFISTIPLGRFSQPSDVANAALFLADPASEFLTGLSIEVDGGRCI